MTTAAQLKKYAKQNIIPFLKDNDFTLVRIFSFVRNRNGIYDIIDFEVYNGGWGLRVIVQCWVPEIDPDFDFSKFPKKLPPEITTGGYLNRFGEIGFGGASWNIREEKEIIIAYEEIMALLGEVALPWFKVIDNRKKLVSVINSEAKNQPGYKDIEESILAGAES